MSKATSTLYDYFVHRSKIHMSYFAPTAFHWDGGLDQWPLRPMDLLRASQGSAAYTFSQDLLENLLSSWKAGVEPAARYNAASSRSSRDTRSSSCSMIARTVMPGIFTRTSRLE